MKHGTKESKITKCNLIRFASQVRSNRVYPCFSQPLNQTCTTDQVLAAAQTSDRNSSTNGDKQKPLTLRFLSFGAQTSSEQQHAFVRRNKKSTSMTDLFTRKCPTIQSCLRIQSYLSKLLFALLPGLFYHLALLSIGIVCLYFSI
ncbi:hypothetical protein HanIR_Chr17g0884781 [Helianthus annuus]|nr:hypothetical protein HanIR_Chr17g0884781 [Helianthus annuus]